jgi:hypothetical protein
MLRRLTESQVIDKAAKGARVVDLRDPVAFRDGSVHGSTNMTLRQISSLSVHPKDKLLVLVGDPADEATLKAALRYVEGYGLMNIAVFVPSPGWQP